MTISNFISENKSKIDYHSTYNLIETGNYSIKSILEQRGTKCSCKNIGKKINESRRETYE